MRVAVVDDDPAYIHIIEDFIVRYQEESGEPVALSAFRDGSELVEHYRPEYDVIFLDIEMKLMDGMETARRIRALDGTVVMVFITNMPQFAIEGYKVGALDYVLKPISYFAFSLKLRQAAKLLQQREKHYLLLASSETTRKLDTEEIRFIEVENHRLFVHTGEDTFSAIGSLNDLEKKLEGLPFVRCNNCYLVNLRYVEELRQSSVVVTGRELQVSRARRKELLQALTRYVGQKR